MSLIDLGNDDCGFNLIETKSDLKTPNCQDLKACKMGLVLINCVRHYLMLKCMIKYAN